MGSAKRNISTRFDFFFITQFNTFSHFRLCSSLQVWKFWSKQRNFRNGRLLQRWCLLQKRKSHSCVCCKRHRVKLKVSIHEIVLSFFECQPLLKDYAKNWSFFPTLGVAAFSSSGWVQGGNSSSLNGRNDCPYDGVFIYEGQFRHDVKMTGWYKVETLADKNLSSVRMRTCIQVWKLRVE